jgi:putative hydrolase of the HAD superfamily
VSEAVPKAILLDLDDTILDDSGDTARCWREACLAHVADLGGEGASALVLAIERVRRWYWADAERHRVGRLDLDAARREIVELALREVRLECADLAGLGEDAALTALAAKVADWYGAERDRGMSLFDDAIDTIRWLRGRGSKLALVTNGNGAAQRRKVERFGLAVWFDVILIEGELGYGKPDERVYRLALERLGVPAMKAWMIGDNLEWDVAAPQRLGIRGIWIDARGIGVSPGHAARPDRIIRRLSDLRNGGAS